LNDSDPNVMTYLLKSRTGAALVILNFSPQSQTVALDTSRIGSSALRLLMATNPQTKTVNPAQMVLDAYGVVIAEVAQ
jgi:hypothetical protein